MRGYSEGLLIGRDGYMISTELLFPLGPRMISARKNKEKFIHFTWNYLEGFLFADHAGVFPYKGSGVGTQVYDQNDFMMSIGCGIRINLPKDIILRLSWGVLLKNNNHEEIDKRWRFHFELSLRKPKQKNIEKDQADISKTKIVQNDNALRQRQV